MIHRNAMGQGGLLGALMASAAMACIAYFIGQPPRLTGDMGICLPSANLWPLDSLWGWIANLAVIALTLVTLGLVNHQYTFVQGSDTVMTGMFAIMVTSNLWTCGTLSSSALIALANLICLLVLFGCYRKRNATQELCVIATILSLGSMIQYAFIFMIPAFLIGAGLLKCLNFKGVVAFLLGLVAPYWVGLGLGIISVADFTMPTMTNLFDGYSSKTTLLIGLLNIGVTLLICLILSLGNMVKLYAGNTQRRLYNLVIDLLGLTSALCIVFDADNMVAYMCTFYMIAAVQFGNLFALRSIYRGGRWAFALSLLYIGAFTAMLTIR